MANRDDVRAALRRLIGTRCLIHSDQILGRIVGIAVECDLEDLEKRIALTVFVVDLSFDDLRKLSGAELCFLTKQSACKRLLWFPFQCDLHHGLRARRYRRMHSSPESVIRSANL